MPNPNRAKRTEVVVSRLREALRENRVYPSGHDDHYRRVLMPIEEIGIECDGGCGALIDATDVLDFMVSEGEQAGPEQALSVGWRCEGCQDQQEAR